MTPAQFIDSVALSGLLPAPLIIFSTFVGYVGRGLAGALLITAGTFAPAFCFTLLGHEHFERLVQAARVRLLLDCVMAAVVGLIAATAIGVVLAVLFVINRRWITPVVIVWLRPAARHFSRTRVTNSLLCPDQPARTRSGKP